MVRQSDLLIWSVRSVWFIWLNQTNRINQMNQINKTNQINQTDRACPARLSSSQAHERTVEALACQHSFSAAYYGLIVERSGTD